MASNDELEVTEKKNIFELCTSFLTGWNSISAEDFVCRRISFGVGNKTYYCAIDASKSPCYNDVEHREVVVHVSGHLFKTNKSILKLNGVEALICSILNTIGMAPKLLGVFEEGRIEEFIPSKVASVEDLASLELGKAVMRKIARLHSLSMPISKQANLLDKVANIYRSTNITKEIMQSFSPEKLKACLTLLEFPFEEEFKWISKLLPKVGYKVVFSHNDINPNNILLREHYTSIDDRIMLIDYELCNYFYRSYDISYFFRRKNMRLQMKGKIVAAQSEDIENSHRDALLQEYLNEQKKLNPEQYDPNYDNFERFSMEVYFFDLVCDLFSIALRKVIFQDSDLLFNWDLVSSSQHKYDKKKQSWLQNYGQIFDN